MKIKFENTLQFARQLDQNDKLKALRSKFFIPKFQGKPGIYFSGHSLGLQPRQVSSYIIGELKEWAALGVDGHEHAKNPWLYYHKLSKKELSNLTGAKPAEVVAMNQLTVNLHLMMVSFYRPTPQRFKILTEAGAFSSDQYVFESQIKFHGLNPEALIEIRPRFGEVTLREDDILKAIAENREELSLVIFGGVQYYTGQFFNIRKITQAGHEAGAVVGFDLAHAIGNVELNLHRDQVDFAVWCSYKYLNSGPGGIAGVFIHEKNFKKKELNRFAGWWGHHETERFKMHKGFKPMKGVDGWQVSNVPIFQAAAHLASLDLFQKAGMKALRQKSILLTGYLEYLLSTIDRDGKHFEVITPSNPKERGCQLSVSIRRNGKRIFSLLIQKGVSVDWRDPNVIRLAPVPLYNTFEEVFRFSKIFEAIIRQTL